MFSLVSIDLVNFRSYRGTHHFDFPSEPGLYNLTGSNEDNPRLGANAAGKSSLLDAIYWCLYGRTPRGLRASDVVTWGEKGCCVSLRLVIGQNEEKISRSQSPNALSLGGKPVTQEELQKFIQLAPEAFTYAVMLPQFGESFFDLSPAAKLSLFSDIMELEFWLGRSKEASNLAELLMQDITALKASTDSYKQQLDTVKRDIASLSEEVARFDTVQSGEIAALSQRKDENKHLLAIFPAQIKRAADSKAAAEHKLAEAQKKIAKASVDHARLDDIEHQLKTFGKGTCPTCGQAVDAAHLRKEQAALVAALKIEDSIKRDVSTIKKNVDGFSAEESMLKSKVERLKSEIDYTDTLIKRERERTNPFGHMIKSKISDQKNLKKKLEEDVEKLRQVQEDHTAVTYWVGGFKKIRLFIIDSTLQQLEIEVNNNLAQLGLLNWRIEFDIERENKSGGLTKGFTVLVHSPGRDQPVKFETWSGGETQRLRLAGDLGLANLIMNRSGLINTIEFFDEPSRHLSQEGLIDVAETLKQRAETMGKVIFLVDHNALDFGGFAGRIIAVKDKDGSHLTEA